MKIILTNDDGINAQGMLSLVSCLSQLKDIELYIVAPEQDQSGTGMSFSFQVPVSVTPYNYPLPVKQAWAIGGTPTDCVKIALGALFKDNLPDVIVSGINHGTNISRNTFFSGTVGAATEAQLRDIPSIALSQCQNIESFQEAQGTLFLKDLLAFIQNQTNNHFKNFNVNFPSSNEPWKGMKLVCPGKEFYTAQPTLMGSIDNKSFYSLNAFNLKFFGEPSEEFNAIKNNYVSVAPIWAINHPFEGPTKQEFLEQQKFFANFCENNSETVNI